MNAPRPNIQQSVGVSGWMRLVTRDARTLKVAQDTGWFPNLITDNGMSLIGADDTFQHTYTNNAVIGSSSTTPTVSDSWVGSQIGLPEGIVGSAVYGSVATPTRYTWARQQFRWGVGEGVGTIREVGIYRSVSGTPFFARALVSPVIVKLTSQILDLFYELRFYPDLTDKTGTVLLASSSYAYTLRACQVDAAGLGTPVTPFWMPGYAVAGYTSLNVTYPATGAIGSVTTEPSGIRTDLGGATFATLATSNDSVIWHKTIQLSVGLSDWVIVGGFKSIGVGFYACRWQMQFTPNVPKTNLDLFSLIFRISWTRYS